MITIVSGLPRSGTSLAMQMLVAGGMPVLSDGARVADEDNPRGYLEWERIKTLARDPGCIAEAEGKAVKAISALLRFLPSDREYRVIFVRRELSEVADSQATMIARRKTSAAGDRAAMTAALAAHLREVTAWLNRQTHMPVRWCEYSNLILDPLHEARKIAEFLSMPLNVDAMAEQVVPALHRNRR